MDATTIRVQTVDKRVLALALIAAGLTLAVDLALDMPMKLPGHRALPGALGVMLMAHAAPRTWLLGFALLMPTVLVTLGGAPLWTFVPWLGMTGLLLATWRFGARRAIWFCIVAGLVFGALRFGMLMGGLHKTPQVVRLAGHLAFGGMGGMLAGVLIRFNAQKEEADEA